jgi:haloalkane dehalogenase
MPGGQQHYPTRQAEVTGKTMAYVEAGTGDPIVFLHGNPTSSYLWRNVLPHLAGHGRCIAPDLIGMGASDKLDDSGPGRYRFTEHRRYLDALLETLGVTDRVTLVVHDWGSGLGFDWAYRHPDAVAGIAYMEAIVTPVDWDDWPESAKGVFQGMRSEAGETMVLDRNIFVESILPASIQRTLSEQEMAAYRGPFAEPGEARRPTLTWPREIPVEGHPSDVTEIVATYSHWLATTPIPKLLIRGEPGMILSGRPLAVARGWPNQTEVSVPGLHFLQEDSPDQIGRAVAEFVHGLG